MQLETHPWQINKCTTNLNSHGNNFLTVEHGLPLTATIKHETDNID